MSRPISILFISLSIFVQTNVIECSKSEICPCIPLNTCPDVHQFSKEDAKYLTTILKCSEKGFVRCCKNNEISLPAIKRMDFVENIILTDDVPQIKIVDEDSNIVSTTEAVDITTALDIELEGKSLDPTETTTLTATTQYSDDDDDVESTTIEFEDNLKLPESDRKEKFIMAGDKVAVVYPNLTNTEKIMEHLFLIFPNGEIEAAKAMESIANEPERNNEIVASKPKRVVVRKKLLRKHNDTALIGAESKITESISEPDSMDVERVKETIRQAISNRRRKDDLSTTTALPIDETTLRQRQRQRKKKIKFRKNSTQTVSTTFRSLSRTTLQAQNENREELTTMKPNRKIIYDASSRSNFLKKPHTQLRSHHDDEIIEFTTIKVAPTTTTTSTSIPDAKKNKANNKEEIINTQTATPLVLKVSSRIDDEHRLMIETVHKTLKAIHSGADMRIVQSMIRSHKEKINEIRKKPQLTTTTTTFVPNISTTKPFRGRVRFNKPMSLSESQKHENHHQNQQQQHNVTRTRNLSRTRNTAVTQRTSRTTKQTTVSPVILKLDKNIVYEELDMPPKQKAPADFRASPLFGITMDKFNEFDNGAIEKVYETLRPSANIQNGFFPVIENGTPSSLL
jgi:hypothetical protein